MEPSVALSVAGLVFGGVLASLGVFLGSYHDNLLERIGLSVVAIWCFVQLALYLLEGPGDIGALSLLYFGIATFSLGLVCKQLTNPHNR